MFKCHFREDIDIDLHDDGSAGEKPRQAIEFRRQMFAGAAPSSPEVDEERDCAGSNECIEVVRGGRHPGCCEWRDRNSATSASGALGDTMAEHSVSRVTETTAQNQGRDLDHRSRNGVQRED